MEKQFKDNLKYYNIVVYYNMNSKKLTKLQIKENEIKSLKKTIKDLITSK